MNCPATRGSRELFGGFIAPPHGELLYLTKGARGFRGCWIAGFMGLDGTRVKSRSKIIMHLKEKTI